MRNGKNSKRRKLKKDPPVRKAYRDPTADAAIAHVMWEEKMKKKKEKKASA